MSPTATIPDAWLDAFGRLTAETGDDPTWLIDLRRRSMHEFVTHGMPTPRHEDWIYTNLAPLADRRFHRAHKAPTPAVPVIEGHALDAITGPRLVFVNGHYDERLSRVADLPAGVTARTLKAALQADPDRMRACLDVPGTTGHPFLDLNTAFIEDGVVLDIKAGVSAPDPIQVICIMTSWQSDVVEHPRLIVTVGAGADAALVERYEAQGPGDRFTNAITRIALEDNATLRHVRIQRESKTSFHIGRTHVTQGRDSTYESVTISLGGALSRHEIEVDLAGPGASCALDGLYTLGGNEHVDNHTVIHHRVPDCTSSELYKGILGGHARGAFTGKMVVHRDAQHTSSTQANHSLLLSHDATASTRPQLEIYADDVQCAHGATIGQLDEDQAFYLRTRGLTPLQARNLLIHGFAREVIERIKHDETRALVTLVLEARLNVDVA